MSFIKKLCPQCNKGSIKEEQKWSNERVIVFTCGHLSQETLLDINETIDLSPSIDNKVMYPFQIEGVKAAIESNARILIGDEMGLGKTVQAIKTLMSRKELLPVAVFCKASVRVQWMKELMRWSNMQLFCQPITDSKDEMEKGHDCYLFSLDLLRRFNGELKEQFGTCGIKTVIIDECQLIKNHQSQRSIEVRELCKLVNHVLALSGTPIKNRASEFFSILNILLPETFPVYERFLSQYVRIYYDSYGRPKYGGLKDIDLFFEKLGGHYIRRLREEVMPELPKINRSFRFIELGKEVQKAYEKELEGLIDLMETGGSTSEQGGFAYMSNVLAYLGRMRHLTGLAKINTTADFIEEFLLNTDRQLTVFCHHKDVHQLILSRLKESNELIGEKEPLSLTADLPVDTRARLQQQFLNVESRLLVASELAFGEGLNLQSCSDCVLVERQWNPANEEQAESRFVRIGQKASQVNSTYVIATGTVDEYLTEIVEAKREQVKQSLGDASDVPWDQTDVITQLCERLAGQKRWKL